MKSREGRKKALADRPEISFGNQLENQLSREVTQMLPTELREIALVPSLLPQTSLDKYLATR
jgi:hypothetical protein